MIYTYPHKAMLRGDIFYLEKIMKWFVGHLFRVHFLYWRFLFLHFVTSVQMFGQIVHQQSYNLPYLCKKIRNLF